MFDGSVSSAGLISHYLDIGIQPHAKYPPIESRLNVTKLHGADIVLGSNWMIRHGIRLDLAKRTISLVAPSQVPPSIPQSSPAVLKVPRHAEDRLARTRTTLFLRVKPSGRLVQIKKHQLRRVHRASPKFREPSQSEP
jgi:hypothetical protein